MIQHPPPKRRFRRSEDEADVASRGLCWVSLTSLVAFVPVCRVLPGNGQAHPKLYVKTHPATVLENCPTCKARQGELCSQAGSYYRPKPFVMNMPHGDRIRAWAKHQRRSTQ